MPYAAGFFYSGLQMSLLDAESASDSWSTDKPHWNWANPRLEKQQNPQLHIKKSAQQVQILDMDFPRRMNMPLDFHLLRNMTN